MLNTLYMFFKPHLLPLLYALVIVALLPLLAGYVVLLERKVMADMQARLGPMRVGPHGLLQPIADAVKVLLKEDIIPESADKWIFWLAPLLSVTAAMLAMAALPFGPVFQIADMNVGLLFILGIGSMGIYRNRAGWMGFEQPLFIAGGVAQRGATCKLRNSGRHGRGERRDAGRDAQHARARRSAIAEPPLVYFPGADRLLSISGGIHRGNQPRAI